MRGSLFSSLDWQHSLGHGEDSRLCPPHTRANPPNSLRPCRHHTHTHTPSCRAAAVAPSLSILLGSLSICLSARAPSTREREGEMGAQVGPAEITCQPGEHLHSLTCPLLSRQTKFNQRERPSGNRLESPAYQALVKLSDFLPWWGNDSCSYPGLASLSESANECLIGAESWRTQPICLGIWAICAHGLSISPTAELLVSAMVPSLGMRGHGHQTAVGSCRVPSPGQPRPPAW